MDKIQERNNLSQFAGHNMKLTNEINQLLSPEFYN